MGFTLAYHKTIEKLRLERTSGDHLAQLCSEQVQLDEVVQGYVRVRIQYPWGWRYHNQTVYLFPNLTTLVMKIKEVLISNHNCPCCSLCPLPFVLSLLARVHLLPTRSPELLLTQAAPAHTVGWDYSIADAGLQLRAKWKERQDTKDNCHKWLNGVQGRKVIVETYSFHWIPTSSFFYGAISAAQFFVTWCAGAGWERHQIINYVM